MGNDEGVKSWKDIRAERVTPEMEEGIARERELLEEALEKESYPAADSASVSASG